MKTEEKYRRLLLVERALQGVDFEKIASVMKHLNWRWGRNGSMNVPDRYELEEAARNLAAGLMLSDAFLGTGSGGLEVRTDKKRTFISIWFSLTEGSSDMDDLNYAVGDI